MKAWLNPLAPRTQTTPTPAIPGGNATLQLQFTQTEQTAMLRSPVISSGFIVFRTTPEERVASTGRYH